MHGGKEGGPDALEGLRPGTTVVVHYTIDGAEEAVEEIDDVASEGLKVSEADEGLNGTGAVRVTVYYSDESGRKVAHFIKKTP